MSRDLNQCNFIGRLGKDPEVRYTTSGDAVANVSLAVGWKSKNSEGTEWVNVVAWGKLAELFGEYLKKGSKVFIAGSMRTRKWQDKNTGTDRYTTEILAKEMLMLEAKQDSGQGGEQMRDAQQEPAKAPMDDDSFDDDIPF